MITPLGETQEFQLGGLIRRTYLDPTSPTVIAGISSDVVVASQLTSTVDGGGEGGVIFDSAVALWQVSCGAQGGANDACLSSPFIGCVSTFGQVCRVPE